jgi:hypothetical protein
VLEVAFCTEALCLFAKKIHKLWTHYTIWETGIIFNVGCDRQLSAGLTAFKNKGL